MGTRKEKKNTGRSPQMFDVCQVSILPICPQLTSLIAEFMHNIGATDAGVAQKWQSCASSIFWIIKARRHKS